MNDKYEMTELTDEDLDEVVGGIKSHQLNPRMKETAELKDPGELSEMLRGQHGLSVFAKGNSDPHNLANYTETSR